MANDMKTKAGRLTRYALSCGYCEHKDTDYTSADYVSIRLCMNDGIVTVSRHTRSTGVIAAIQAGFTIEETCLLLGLLSKLGVL